MKDVSVRGGIKGTLQACKQSRAWQQGVQLLHKMRREKMVPDLFAWTSVIACCSNGHWQLAMSLVDEMVEVSLQPNVVCYNGVLSALSRGSQAELALPTWRSWEAQGVVPSTVTFTALMSSSSWDDALELLRSMFQRRMQVDLVAWNTALNACADGRSWSHALHLLQQMEGNQLSPDIISFSSCVAACATAAWQRSVQLFARAQQRLDAQICVAVLSACATESCWQPALQVLQHHPSLLHSTSGLGALIPALVTSWPRAMQLLMQDTRGRADLVTWNTLLAATPWEQGLALLSQMPSRRLTADCASYGAVLRSCENVHEWEAALALQRDMARSQVPPDLPAWCSTLSACEKGRQWQRCLLILAEMWATPAAPDIVAYGAAVSACEKCGQWPSALQLLEDLQRHQLRLDQVAGNAVLSALGSGQQWLMALTLFGAMVEEDMVDLISYNAMIDQCPWHQALALSEDMRSTHLAPDLITSAALSQRLETAAGAVAAQRRCCATLEMQGLALLQRRVG